MASRLPDFIIGGAPRCGTSWLYNALERHPEIYMAKPLRPEPKFFLVDDLYSRGIDYYRQTWFQDVSAKKIAGEKSTNYLESAQAAKRIKDCLPGIKLVFILRNPVERAYSNYLWSKHNQQETEDFETALALEEKREHELSGDRQYARPHAYFSRGLYAQELTPYFERFPRKNILCVRFEDILKDAGGFLTGIHKFLGVTIRAEDARGLGPVNPIKDKDSMTMSASVREKLLRAYEAPNRELAGLLGAEFVEPWRFL